MTPPSLNAGPILTPTPLGALVSHAESTPWLNVKIISAAAVKDRPDTDCF
jgi:hypothetical protein